MKYVIVILAMLLVGCSNMFMGSISTPEPFIFNPDLFVFDSDTFIDIEEDGIHADDTNLVGEFVSLPQGAENKEYYVVFLNNGNHYRGDSISGQHPETFTWDTRVDNNDVDNMREFVFNDEIEEYFNYTLEQIGDEWCLSIWFGGAPTEGYKYYRDIE